MRGLEELNRLSRQRGLDFLVIGGLAVLHHGYSRETADLDLLVRKDQRASWLDLLASLSYRLACDGEVFIQLEPPSQTAWPVDLMLVSEASFRPMQEQSLEVEFLNTRGRIPCLEHLISLKLHALKHGRMHRFLKDFQDVEGMVRKNRLDIHSERIRQLFLKYGTMDLYEKTVRSCSDE